MAIQKITSGIIADGAIVATDVADGSIANTKLSATGTANSSTYLRGDNAWSPISSIYDGTSNVSVTSTNGNVIIGTAGSERVRIGTTGNVSIGTTTLNDRFTITHSDESGITFKATGTDGATAAQLFFEDTNGGTGGVLRFDHDVNSFTFATAGTTERMRINSSGYVTMPSQASFMAAANFAVETYAAGAKIAFDTVGTHNTGNNYSTANRRFTAPVDGVYLFSLSVWCQASGSPQITLRVNNAEPRYAIDVTMLAGGYTGNRGFAVMLKLSANDYVEPFTRIDGSSGDLYGRHSHFSGHLLG